MASGEQLAAGANVTANFEHMRELKWRWGYPMALTVMVGVCGLMSRHFRKAGWL